MGCFEQPIKYILKNLYKSLDNLADKCYNKHIKKGKAILNTRKAIDMNGYSKKYMKKSDKKKDIIKGIKKYLKVGMYDQVYLLEKELHEVYGMSYSEIEKAEFA